MKIADRAENRGCRECVRRRGFHAPAPGTPRTLWPKHEERGPRVVSAEQLEHGARRHRVRPVVEGQRHAARTRLGRGPGRRRTCRTAARARPRSRTKPGRRGPSRARAIPANAAKKARTKRAKRGSTARARGALSARQRGPNVRWQRHTFLSLPRARRSCNVPRRRAVHDARLRQVLRPGLRRDLAVCARADGCA